MVGKNGSIFRQKKMGVGELMDLVRIRLAWWINSCIPILKQLALNNLFISILELPLARRKNGEIKPIVWDPTPSGCWKFNVHKSFFR